MSVVVTLGATPARQQAGRQITFTGNVSAGNIPFQGLFVFFRDASTDAPLRDQTDTPIRATTDSQGNYSIKWTPTVQWIGVFSVYAMVIVEQMFFSAPVNIEVTEQAPPASSSMMSLLLVGVIALALFSTRK